ncbi:LuxR C-terminal-related transcriptional regulator [Streptomyces sp. NPDC053726]|uniref:response regulator transcription factor n=1 Tax=Streptomyces sp. NPDC053726 TaxID=3365713 RepID=UPI0037D43AB8
MHPKHMLAGGKGMTLRIATYNMLDGGIDGFDSGGDLSTVRWEQQMALLRDVVMPDVLCLQEAKHFDKDDDKMAGATAEALGMDWRLAPSASHGCHLMTLVRPGRAAFMDFMCWPPKAWLTSWCAGRSWTRPLRDGFPTTCPATQASHRSPDIYQRRLQVTTASTACLTPRQHDVVRLLADGLLPAQIADTLNLRTTTVREYKDVAAHRLGVHGTPALVQAAYESGALGQPEPAPDADDGPICLPDTQREVLALLAKGMTVGEMADHLHWPEHVVRKDARSLIAALGAKNPAHAITRAWQLGFLGVPDTGRLS